MRPAKPPATHPHDERYWDPRDLERELERVFTVCHGCRMCLPYCPSFPELFERVDGYVRLKKGEVEAFDARDYEVVNDLCYQCKMCYFKCPYTPDDDHAFMIDFPALMARHRAQRSARDGVSIEDRVLGEPQLVGRLGSMGTPISNLVSKSSLLRKVQEAATGMSAEFNLPPFAPRTLAKWSRSRAASARAGSRGDVVLFSTCTVNYNLPAAGMAAIQVLEHNGYRVHFPKQQTCCGMPNLDGGDVEAATAKARQNVATLFPFVSKGFQVVVPGPTCGLVLKREYPELVGTDEAREVARNTVDLLEFLRDLQKKKELSLEFERSLGRVGYHAPCHLRMQKIGFPAMQLLRKVPDTEVTVIQECSAVDGTWGMKAANYELGKKYAQKLVGEMRTGNFDLVATDCPLSGLRLEQELGVPPRHPVELLNDAYGLPAVRDESPVGRPIAREE